MRRHRGLGLPSEAHRTNVLDTDAGVSRIDLRVDAKQNLPRTHSDLLENTALHIDKSSVCLELTDDYLVSLTIR